MSAWLRIISVLSTSSAVKTLWGVNSSAMKCVSNTLRNLLSSFAQLRPSPEAGKRRFEQQVEKNMESNVSGKKKSSMQKKTE
jgi:hypothetical protein